MNKEDIKVGRKVGIKTVGNASRYKGSEYYEGIITKVGRKYFYVTIPGKQYIHGTNIEDGIPFKLETFFQKTDYSAIFEVYPDLQTAKESEQIKTVIAKIREGLSYGSWRDYTLDDMKKVADILNIEL